MTKAWTPPRKITRRQAEATLRAVEKQFAPWLKDVTDPDDRPQLYEDWDGPGWVIIWESNSPYEWPQYVNGGGIEEEFGFNIKPGKYPKTVFAEPVNNCVLGLYRAHKWV